MGERNGRPTKLPINPDSGEPASCADPSTWGTYEQAVERFKRGGVDGIGFQLGADYVGVDLDKCRNPETAAVKPWAQKIIRQLCSLTEISPSGTGIHIWVKGVLPKSGRRKGRIEIYDSSRYFTVTGRHLQGTPDTINERRAELLALHARLFTNKNGKSKASAGTRSAGPVGPSSSMSDSELIDRAMSAKNGEKFSRFWAGNWGADYASQSEADLALCCMLAFWTQRDSGRIDKLFRQSGLYREKWNERHGADGRTYGEITVDKAVEETSEVYTPGGRGEKISPKAGSADQHLPVIVVNSRQLRDVTADALKSLVGANEPPVFFVRGGKLARVRKDEEHVPIIDTVGEYELRAHLARAADYVRLNDKGESPCPPPKDVVGDILGLGQWNFPPLHGIVEVPILRPDGTVLAEPGYDPSTHLLYSPADGLKVPAIPSNPSADDVAAARALLDEAIGDFPYIDEASRANAFGLLLTPVVRPAIPGLVPLACIDAPQAGTGKGLLASVVSLIGTGREKGSMSAPRNDDEWRKRITAALLGGSTFIVIDNIDNEIRSPSLASALTASVWRDRILGHSTIVAIAQRATWVANGNNLRLGGDIPRRCYWIRLDAKTSRPWKRTGFTHPELIPWVFENRGRLLAALLTIAVSWFAAGKPAATSTVPVIGGFEGWSRTIGGILDHAGVLDLGTGRLAFLGNSEEMYELADESAGQWENFLQALSKAYPDESFTAKNLAERLGADQLLRDVLPDELDNAQKPESLSRCLGKAFSRRSGTRYGEKNLHLERDGQEKRATKWRVVVG